MNETLNLLIGLTMGCSLLSLGTSRLPRLINAVGAQGFFLGCMPLAMGHTGWENILLSLATITAKGLIMPYLLHRAMRTARITQELHPSINYLPSLLLGALGTVCAVIFGCQLPLLPEHRATLLIPGALTLFITGLLLLMGRTKAIAQVCGYLTLENGICLAGLLLVKSTPLLVESGILLDVIVGVFIIGILVDRIQKTFDSLDTRKLTALHE